MCDKCRAALNSWHWHLVWGIKLEWSPVKFVVIEDGCNDDDFHLWVSRCFIKVNFNTITWCCCCFSYISGLPVMKRILLFFILAAAVMYGILHGNLWRNNLYWYDDALFTCADTLMAMWEMWLWAAVSLNSCLLDINRSHYHSLCLFWGCGVVVVVSFLFVCWVFVSVFVLLYWGSECDCSVLSPTSLVSLLNLVVNLSLIGWKGQDLRDSEPLWVLWK